MIGGLFARWRKTAPVFDAPLAPAAPFAVIGDVHGCDALLAAMLAQLPQEMAVVLVGDLIDRGEDSRAVIDRVMGDARLICLLGNHEAMALAFLDDPVAQGPRWLRNGGLQTLASFGVGAMRETADAFGLNTARDAFAEALGPARIGWLRARPLLWRSGNVAVTHAGADPGRPLDAQETRALLWGHPEFGRRARDDGQWVVHGHVIVDAAQAQAGRIAVDTGAYATGRLSAALIGPDRVTFVTACA